MVRGRRVPRRIENKASRQVSFSKRRNELFKEAQELSVLCDADVGLIVVSAKGKLYEFSSSNCMEKVVDRYRQFSDAETVNKVKEDMRPKKLSADSGTSLEAPKFLQRSMDGSDFPKLNLEELNKMDKELQTALAITRTRKTLLMTDMIDGLQEKVNELLRKRNYMQSILNQAQTKNGRNNEAAASREAIKNNGDLEVYREKNNTWFPPSTISENTINARTDAPGAVAENRPTRQIPTHPSEKANSPLSLAQSPCI